MITSSRNVIYNIANKLACDHNNFMITFGVFYKKRYNNNNNNNNNNNSMVYNLLSVEQ